MYKEVFAGDLRQGDTLADGVMVIVSQGGIDMAVSVPDGSSDGAGTLVAPSVECA